MGGARKVTRPVVKSAAGPIVAPPVPNLGRMVSFERHGAKFTYRAAAVILDANRVLLTKGVNDDFWYLPGGRIELLEPARDALAREMVEELGLEVWIDRLVWTVENFFEFDGRRIHELGLYFLVELPQDCMVFRKAEFAGLEERYPIVFRWFDLQSIADLEIYPAFLRKALADLPASPEHVVNFDAIS
jgi:8-oxo-dGTP pyrophosphatase MutT (NUDIX family)